MEKRPAYLGTRSDYFTHVHDLPPQLGGIALVYQEIFPVMWCCREALYLHSDIAFALGQLSISAMILRMVSKELCRVYTDWQ